MEGEEEEDLADLRHFITDEGVEDVDLLIERHLEFRVGGIWVLHREDFGKKLRSLLADDRVGNLRS